MKFIKDNYSNIFLILFCILLSYIFGLKIISTIDNRLSKISIKIPKQNIILNVKQEKLQKRKIKKKKEINIPNLISQNDISLKKNEKFINPNILQIKKNYNKLNNSIQDSHYYYLQHQNNFSPNPL